MNDTTPRGEFQTVRRRLLLAACAVIVTATAPAPALADLVGVLPRVKPSIVAVGTFQRTRSPAFQFRGTGFVVGDGRLIVTNAHVLPDTVATDKMEALVIAVPGADESAMARPVVRIAADRERDLAVLRLEGGPALPALTLARDERVQEGQEIAFTGFPIGAVLGLTPVTHRGIISAVTPIGIPQGKARDLNPALVRRLANDVFRVYQLDATAYPGNSGSPMFDPRTGEVIGVLNMVFVKSTKENVLSDPSGISYAIPVEYVNRLLAGAH
ncbi:MAG: serine protease Do [Thauera sp.]|nr:serine protease [Thauera sp.]MDI3491086.1 serine protease Do [Thauera sp.]